MIVITRDTEFLTKTGEWTTERSRAKTWNTWLGAMKVADRVGGVAELAY